MPDAPAPPALRVPPHLVARVPPAFARRHRVILLDETPSGFVVAAAAPVRAEAISHLETLMGKRAEVVEAPAEAIEREQERLWGLPRRRKSNFDRSALAEAAEGPAEIDGAEYRLGDEDPDAPAVRAVTEMLDRAVRNRASDVHLETYPGKLVIRERRDGILHDALAPDPSLHAAIVSRIKILSRLPPEEKRRPLDGRFTVVVQGRTIDVRVSVLPSIHGETVVMRLLDRASVRFDLEALGFPPDLLGAWRRLATLPTGLVLVTGPTGSGKTTTLYATLQEVNTPERKIQTLEDPVEYEFEGIVQNEVNPRTMPFAEGLKRILRADPDVILVGEIRDPETAQIAIEAALTGHLVYSTIHTNDAVSTPARLIEMGVQSYLLASALSGVLAQRLVRKICPHCAQESPADAAPFADAAAEAGFPPGSIVRRGAGCRACRRTGYQDRTAIYELMEVTPQARAAIAARGGSAEIAATTPHRRLLDEGRAKVEAGATTPEEVIRVVRAA